MLTDLVQIRRLGEKKRDENHRLRSYLRNHSYPDRKLRLIAENVEGEIDCTECANCCKVATTRLLERDVEKLARFLRIRPGEFLAGYTTQDPEEGLILRRDDNGCVFLQGNLCSVYDARPSTCTNFPHLIRGSGSLPSRMWQMVDRATYCPIVYNTLEAYKEEFKLTK